MRLHHSPFSTNSRKVLAVARQLGTELELAAVDLFDRGQTAPDYLALNPNGLVPTLEDGETVLWESNAICQYLCERAGAEELWPRELGPRADITRWQFWEASIFGMAVNTVVYETLFRRRMGAGDPSLAEIDRGLSWFHRFAAVLDGHLTGRQWLVGRAPTLADFSVAAPLGYAQAAALPMRTYGNVQAWLGRMDGLAAWAETAHPTLPR